MTSPTVDRRFGLVGNAAIKAPVAAVATSNITLSGQQTIDGVALLATNAAGIADRVLVTGQTDTTQNGIYDVSLSAWSRSIDANGPYDFANGTQVLVGGGTVYRLTVWCLVALSPITVGSSSLLWQLAIGASLGNFLQSGTGAQARTFTSKDRDWVSVMDFGAIGDGTNHLLSERYATLAAAQVVYPHATSLTQSIDWAAFQAAHNSLVPYAGASSSSGGKIIIPSGSYYFTDTWSIQKSCTIVGTNTSLQPANAPCRLRFAKNITGIYFHSVFDGTTAQYSRLEDVEMDCIDATTTSGHGIYSTCPLFLKNVHAREFGGTGCYLNGQGSLSQGTSSFSHVQDCQFFQNKVNGLWSIGSDAGVSLFTNVSCAQNVVCGIRNEGFYASTFINCHVASPGGATNDYYDSGGGVYVGCYSEASAIPSTLNGALVFGGNMAIGATGTNRISTFGAGGGAGILTLEIAATSNMIFAANDAEIARLNWAGWFQTTGASSGFQAVNGSSHIYANPGALDVASSVATAHNMALFTNPNGLVGTIQTNGSATAYNTSSDYRLKENVLAMPAADAIARIMALRPVKYTWKVDGTPGDGFIAHELQEQFPQAVSGHKDGTRIEDVLDADRIKVGTKTVPSYQGVDTSFVVAALVTVVQDLQRRVVALEAQAGVSKEVSQ